MSDTAQRTEADAVADIARESAVAIHTIDPTSLYAVTKPAGTTLDVLNLDKHLSAPRRRTGVYLPNNADSFERFVKQHHDEDHTTIWVDRAKYTITAVLNDNAEAASGWRDHRVALVLALTPEWVHWLSQDGKWLNQDGFAEHLQDGVVEVVEPDAATLMEIATSISAKNNVTFKSATRLDNGEMSFGYHEEIEATAGRQGNLKIPKEFKLAIAPFYGEEPSPITALLRYRIREGKLTLSYKLERPHDVVHASLEAVAVRLGVSFPHVYMGAAPSA